jgi:hypothetical protein
MHNKILQFLSDPRITISKSLSVILVFSAISSSTYAVEISYGDLTGSWDTTFSMGQSFRVNDIDDDLIGLANGGNAFSTNSDNGNLNYRSGTFSRVGKLTTELELNYKNFGLFFRGNGFKDISSDSTDRTPLTNSGERLVVDNLNLLDLYAWGDFNLGSMPLQIRVGEQVLSWGESTFIQNSINTINPVDVSKLRIPGSELRDALTPVGMVWGQLGITENASVEAYYQYDYEHIRIDPQGSFFSANDIAGAGGSQLFLGFGDVSDLGTTIPGPTSIAASLIPGLAPTAALYAAGGTDGLDTGFDAAPRGADNRPGNGGEFGAALRLFVPKLNDTEFGFFFVNYHSRLPVISVNAPTTAGIGNSSVAALSSTCNGAALSLAVAAPDAALIAGCDGALGAGTSAFFAAAAPATAPVVAAAIGPAGALFGASDPFTAAADGANCATAAAFGLPGAALPAFTGFTGSGASFGLQCGLNPAIGSANYFVEYPEDIQLFGFSFNTEVGTTGIALQGEYSFRDDAPLQIDIQELLLAAGTALNNSPVLGASPTVSGTIANNQITNGTVLAPGSYVQGYIEKDISQVQMTATKVFGPTFKADTAVLVGEFAVTHVHDMPSKSVLRLEAPGTDTTGNPFHSGATGFHPGKASESSDHYPDSTSWGYQIRGQLQYLNVLGSLNVLPRFAWRHDVDGITPGPGGNFLEGRKAISLGIGFSYQNEWTADLGYTNFFGAGRHNTLNDRDFVAFSINRSF